MLNSEENIKDTKTEEVENPAEDTTDKAQESEEKCDSEPETEVDEEKADEDMNCDGDEEIADSADDSKESKKEKKFFKKKEKKDKKDEKIEELNDKLMRQMAEFDNYRKRTEKEKLANYVVGARDVIEKLLPVVDNFERGLANADENDPFVDGMSKVYKQLITIFEDLGVEPIEAVGKEFDPNLHNAVMHIDDEELGENIIAEEFQKGYMYKDKVVRHSMVKVAN